MTPLLAFLQDPARASEIPPDQVPALLGELERLKATLWARVMTPAGGNGALALPPEPDRLLTPEDAAKTLGVTTAWLYRHARTLPFARHLSRKCLRFSEAGLRKWQAAKRA